MSKIGKKPIMIPSGTAVEIKDGLLYCKGGKGELVLPILPYCGVEIKDGENGKEILVRVSHDNRQARANWGTMAALIKNSIQGVTEGFQKKLQLEGIGYRASLEGKTLVLTVGFSHPVKYTPVEGVTIAIEKNIIIISGVDKAVVGEVAAEIRQIKKPEPYQGKGIRYVGEVIRRKAGKKAAAGAGSSS